MSKCKCGIFKGYLLIAHCSLFIVSYFCSPNHSFWDL
jgi:hypothetical protein